MVVTLSTYVWQYIFHAVLYNKLVYKTICIPVRNKSNKWLTY